MYNMLFELYYGPLGPVYFFAITTFGIFTFYFYLAKKFPSF